ncbi:MAG TPA: LEPR-XLL domain-containing protein, partial [Gemmataceae bacterium]|nr:LEPR-XLL domain-containing protein [Gemmataceae bacterium]
MEPLEDRIVLAADGLATAVPIAPTGAVTAAIGAAGEQDFFRIDVAESGRLTARAAPDAPLGSRLSLLGPSGELLIQSDGVSSTNPEDRITQHLLAGTYFLRVEGLGGGTGSYTLTT